jgi:dTMP kinase
MGDGVDRRCGWLFVFEGIDGSGKTTHVRRAARALRARGLEVIELVEPTDGTYGRQIRESARAGARRKSPADELALFELDRKENVERNIRPALERGDLILLDRYYYSTIAYQGARRIDPEEIRRSNERFAPGPDRVLYYNVDVATALARIRRKRGGETDLFERQEYLERVKAIYDDLARRLDYFHTIDACADEEAVARETLREIDECMAVGKRP